MGWREIRDDDRITEWERSDGNATVRLRRSPDGTWTVRLDRLHQSADGRGYRRERTDTEADARALVDAWLDEHDVSE